MAIELLIAGGENFRNTLSLFFVQDYIGADKSDDFTSLLRVGLIAIPFWDWLAKKYGKHQSLAFAMVFVSIITIACFMLEVWPGNALLHTLRAQGLCFGAFAYLPRAMLADVVDLDTVKSGSRARRVTSPFWVYDQVRSVLGGLSLPFSGLWGTSSERGHERPDRTSMARYSLRDSANDSIWIGFYLCVTWPLTAKVHARLQRLVEKKQARYAKA